MVIDTRGDEAKRGKNSMLSKEPVVYAEDELLVWVMGRNRIWDCSIDRDIMLQMQVRSGSVRKKT